MWIGQQRQRLGEGPSATRDEVYGPVVFRDDFFQAGETGKSLQIIDHKPDPRVTGGLCHNALQIAGIKSAGCHLPDEPAPLFCPPAQLEYQSGFADATAPDDQNARYLVLFQAVQERFFTQHPGGRRVPNQMIFQGVIGHDQGI